MPSSVHRFDVLRNHIFAVGKHDDQIQKPGHSDFHSECLESSFQSANKNTATQHGCSQSFRHPGATRNGPARTAGEGTSYKHTLEYPSSFREQYVLLEVLSCRWESEAR